MKNLTINVLAKQFISFTSTNFTFVREENNIKTANINYTNGTGQVLTTNQMLLNTGTAGTMGHFSVRVVTGQTLTGAGTFPIEVIAFPTATEVNNTKQITIDGSILSLNCIYNSRPVTTDIEIETDNRTDKIITSSIILSNVTDYDNDSILEVALFGDVTGYYFNNIAYVAGTFVSMTDLDANKLKYVPNDVDATYIKTVTYKVKDSFNNISN